MAAVAVVVLAFVIAVAETATSKEKGKRGAKHDKGGEEDGERVAGTVN